MSEHKFLLAGVVGAPIAHSRSPRLHGHWLKRYGIKGQYVPLEVAQADLELDAYFVLLDEHLGDGGRLHRAGDEHGVCVGGVRSDPHERERQQDEGEAPFHRARG